MRMSRPLAPLPIALFALSGCTMTANEPSLAPRAIERMSASEPAAPQPEAPPLPEDASQQQRVAALVARARDGDARFQQQQTAANRLISAGSGAPLGSEAWVQAQEALSRAENLRTIVTQSLADLDSLQIAAAQNGAGPESAGMLNDAVREVAAIDAREEQALQTLRDRLSAP
jgi:hypothetical protein